MAISVSYSVSGREAGASLGYRLNNVLPYASFVRRTYNANSSSTGGSRSDQGTHTSVALGVDFLNEKKLEIGRGLGFSFIAEVSNTYSVWSEIYSQTSINTGVSAGISW